MTQHQASRMDDSFTTAIYSNGFSHGTDADGSERQPPISMLSFRQPRKISEVLNPNLPDWQQNIEKAAPVGHRKGSPLFQLTMNILGIFRTINPTYTYDSSLNPKRVLTKPSKGTKNHGFDNDNSDYILYVNDFIGSEHSKKYQIIDLLGQGTFGQVAKCQHLGTGQILAVKIIKNEQAYFNQSLMEVTILELLNKKYDPFDQRHITRMLDTFVFRNHLCIVFELLSMNLYELLKQNKHRGFSHSLIQKLLVQIVDALCLMKEAKIIHCDLKPENILLKSIDGPEIKIIDFGSGCHENKAVFTYIQSRFYRSPEVILGLPYTAAIDMWSFGCIALELFLGVPVFPGNSNYDQIKRITETLGMPPNVVMEVGKDVKKYFVKQENPKRFSLKSKELFEREYNVTIGESKRYFSGISLEEIVNLYPISKKKGPLEVEKEKNTRLCFIDFVKGILNLNPLERWTPHQARRHPYITGEPFVAPFNPAMPIDMPYADYANGYVVNPALSTSVIRSGRPRAMTINSMRPQVSIPTPLDRIAAMAGNAPASIPMVGERHYSIVADSATNGEVEESLLALSQNQPHQFPSYPPVPPYNPYADISAMNAAYAHNPMLPIANGVLVGSSSDHSLGYPESQSCNIINQRRISNPFGYTSKFQPATNFHPYPMEIQPYEPSHVAQVPVNPMLIQAPPLVPHGMQMVTSGYPSQQPVASVNLNEGGSFQLAGYNASRRDSIPQDHPSNERLQTKRKNGK